MPTIVIASPKGGAGKSTCSVLLATTFARMEIEVTLLDCDHLTGRKTALEIWQSKAPLPSQITLRNRVGEAEVIKEIKAGEGDGRVVIVDLGGAASRLATRAISQADLVIVPMRPSPLDAEIGIEAIQMIAEEEETLNRAIPWVVVLTATKAVRSKEHRRIRGDLESQGVLVVKEELLERGAFQGFFSDGGDLTTMTATGTQQAAIENAERFAEQILDLLEEGAND